MFSFFDKVARKFTSGKKSDEGFKKNNTVRSRRPHIEALEDRCMLATLFVDASVAVGGGNGASWNTACKSLQAALDIASVAANNVTEIWIADGKYTPTQRITSAEARTATFSLINGVSLYGGFAGNETSKDARAKNADGSFTYKTVLSGDLEANDIDGNPSTLLDNAYSVVYASSISNVTIDGVSITAGNAAPSYQITGTIPAHWTNGGGVALVNCTGITLQGVEIYANSASVGGGAVYVGGGSVTINNSSIYDNTASDSGGGVYLATASLTISGTKFTDNFAANSGGGIYQASGTLNLSNGTLSGNSSGYGGGFAQARNTTARFVDVSFISNVAFDRFSVEGQGGGVHQLGTLDLINATFANNVANIGGGIYVMRPDASTDIGPISTYSNITVSKNVTTGSGGGIFISSGYIVMNNSIVAANTTGTGAANPDIYGESKPTIIFTGSNNLIGDGTGIPQVQATGTIPPPSPSPPPSIRDDVNGNQVGTAASPKDPLLGAPTDFGNGVLVLPLLSGSQAIDKGNNSLVPSGITTDARGQTRISGTVDIGAVEGSTAARSGVTYTVASLADEIKSDSVLTFREAFEAANRNIAVGDAQAGSFTAQDTIRFASGLTGTIMLNGKTLVLYDGLEISGSDLAGLSIDAQSKTGVIKLSGSINLSISDITLKNGYSSGNGGGIVAYSSNLTLDNVAVRNSHTSAVGRGGGIFLSDATADLQDVILSGNSALFGGGLYQVSSNTTVVGASIYQNTASDEGGGFYQTGGNSLLANATVAQNTAPRGAGLAFTNAAATLTNLTVTRNIGTYIGGIGIASGSLLTMYNSIVADNFSYAYDDIYVLRDTEDPGVLSSNSKNNLVGDNTGLSGITNGSNGNIVGSAAAPIAPGFAEPSYYNGQLIYPLLETSRAHNTGDRTLAVGKGGAQLTQDVRGTGYARVSGSNVDMGACERQISLVGNITSPTGLHFLRYGQTLDLVGNVVTASSSGITYLWDLNENGYYGETGAAATQGEEIGKETTYTPEGAVRDPSKPNKARLILVDANGNRSDPVDWDITILVDGPTYTLTGDLTVLQGQMFQWTIKATNVSQDPIMSWTIQWGDGQETVIVGGPRNTIEVRHVYTVPGNYFVNVEAQSLFGFQRQYRIADVSVEPIRTQSAAPAEAASRVELETEFSGQTEISNPVSPQTFVYDTQSSQQLPIQSAVVSDSSEIVFKKKLDAAAVDMFFSESLADDLSDDALDIATLALYEQASERTIAATIDFDDLWLDDRKIRFDDYTRVG